MVMSTIIKRQESTKEDPLNRGKTTLNVKLKYVFFCFNPLFDFYFFKNHLSVNREYIVQVTELS